MLDQPRTHNRRIGGFSLIEVLISLVILSVGLLGIAAMVSVSLKSKDGSYMRTQATMLTSVMLDRMRANRATATAAGYDTTFTQAAGAVPSGDCTGSGANCSPTDIANLDLSLWKTDLNNLLPNGFGSITTQTVNQMTQVTISVQWNDQRATKAVGGGTASAPAAATATFSITSGL